MIVIATEEMLRVIEARNQQYEGTRHAAFDDESMKIAVLCEWAFGRWSGQMVDFKDRDGGDGGIDFNLPVKLTADVKGIKNGYQYLLHKVDKPFADLFVLASCDLSVPSVTLLGWTWGSDLKQAEVKRMRSDGYPSHCMHREQLRPMAELQRMLPFRPEEAK